MKIAIMGAGLSGLSCALILEQQQVKPTLFENRNCVGDRFINGEIFLPILTRPLNDPFAYLAEKYNIYMQPANNITALSLFSEHAQAQIKGQLGFTDLRGRAETSLEKQLAKQLSSPIIFNSKYTYEDLQKEFTHIILAVGDHSYTTKMQKLKPDFTVTLKGATVSGSFKKREVAAWLDNNLAPQGYCYLIPYSNTEANITLAYPDHPQVTKPNIDTLWERFYERVCTNTNQNLKITDQFEIENYMVGLCDQPRIGNTFFTGNCMGTIMPVLGFGQTESILSGIYAAQDLLGKGNYNKLTKPMRESYKNSLILRHALEKLDNHGYDTLIRLLDTKLANKLFNNRRINIMKVISYLLRPFIK